MRGRRRPTGTLTFLFTDLERSTRLWEERPDAMGPALRRHDECVRVAIDTHGGFVFATGGDGFAAAFGSAAAAALAAVAAQRGLATEDPRGGLLRARMALHTGVAEERDGNYFGPAVNRTARLMGVAYGNQVLVSQVTSELLRSQLPEGMGLVDLGRHRLRDLPEPQRVFQLIAAGLPTEFPPLRSIDVLLSNLPIPRSTFIGRQRELDTLSGFLRGRPLTTLVGPGGSGKTRLAIEAARAMIADYPDGVWFVDLSSAREPVAVVAEVASAVRMPAGGSSGGSRSVRDELVDFLAGRSVLLVLDNCEHLLDACADLLEALFRVLSAVRVLATSREPVGINGEQIYRLGPLGVEGADSEAQRLFVDRARLVDPAFDPAGVTDVVAEICRRLDGIPLAIELAAACVAHFSPADIASRLDDRFTLLHGGRRTARQQTLATTVEWSHALLDEVERAVLRRCAVFVAGFTLAAAQAVCAGDDVAPEVAARALGSLVRRSMVQAEPAEGGGLRYGLLETIRLYAQHRLWDAGETDAVRARHRDWFVAWAHETTHAGEWSGPIRPERAADLDNVRAALDWCEQDGRMDLAVRLLEDYYPLLCLGSPHANIERLTRIRARVTDPADRDALDLVTAYLAQYLGDHTETIAVVERLRERASSPRIRAAAQALLAFVLAAVDPDRARRLVADVEGTGYASYRLVAVRMVVALATGDYASAIDIAGRLVPPGSAGLTTIAAARHLLGDQDGVDEVVERFEDTRLRHRWPGDYYGAFFRALAAGARGNHAEAEAQRKEVLRRVEQSRVALGRGEAVLARALGALQAGEFERACELFAAFRASARWPWRSPATLVLYRHYLGVLRATLPPDTTGRARARGAALSLDEALAR